MHTATRIAIEAIPRIRALATAAHLCVYGLYAPMNEALLRELGVGTVLGGEFEPRLLNLAGRLRSDRHAEVQTEPVISLGRIEFLTPRSNRASAACPLRPSAIAGRERQGRGLCRGQPGLQALVPPLSGGARVPGKIP